jgi:hypothetical protein
MKTKSKLGRRTFLLAVGAGSTAAVAAVASRAIQSDAPVKTAEDKKGGKGYQETAHVRRYYNTAKV